jgi:hypothetical protein
LGVDRDMIMEKNNKPRFVHSWPVFLVLVVSLLTPVSALAYLDPTTGSMLISAIVGLFASLVLAIKTYWYRIKKIFSRKPAQSEVDDKTS